MKSGRKLPLSSWSQPKNLMYQFMPNEYNRNNNTPHPHVLMTLSKYFPLHIQETVELRENRVEVNRECWELKGEISNSRIRQQIMEFRYGRSTQWYLSYKDRGSLLHEDHHTVEQGPGRTGIAVLVVVCRNTIPIRVPKITFRFAIAARGSATSGHNVALSGWPNFQAISLCKYHRSFPSMPCGPHSS